MTLSCQSLQPQSLGVSGILQQMDSNTPLTDEQRQMVADNIGLVYAVAQTHYWFDNRLDDIIQEGLIGLMHAIRKFDPEKGFAVSTYATHYIRAYMQRARLSDKTVRHKSFKPANANKFKHSTRLAIEMGIHMMSLDRKRTTKDPDNSSLTLYDILEDTTLPPAEKLATDAIDLQTIEREVCKLPDRVLNIFCLYFHTGLTYEQIGKRYGLTRERIRQIVDEAIETIQRALGIEPKGGW